LDARHIFLTHKEGQTPKKCTLYDFFIRTQKSVKEKCIYDMLEMIIQSLNPIQPKLYLLI